MASAPVTARVPALVSPVASARKAATAGHAPQHSIARAAKFFGWLVFSFLLLHTFIGEASVVPTASMQNTILVGDHLLWTKALYGPELPFLHWRLPRMRRVRRGQIIAFRYPLDPQQVYLKRAVAMGGDRVEIRNGVLWLNGAATLEPYAFHTAPLISANAGQAEHMPARTVPSGEIFVLGDNRDNSSDSRDWGPVPEQNVLGSPLLVLWSYNAPPSQWLDWTLAHQVRFSCAAIPHLFTRTRWSRTFTL